MKILPPTLTIKKENVLNLDKSFKNKLQEIRDLVQQGNSCTDIEIALKEGREGDKETIIELLDVRRNCIDQLTNALVKSLEQTDIVLAQSGKIRNNNEALMAQCKQLREDNKEMSAFILDAMVDCTGFEGRA